MFRKVMITSISILLCLLLLIPAYAQTTTFVADEAGLLTQKESAVLEEKAAALNERYGINAVILIIDSLYGSRAQDYADDYYDNTGYAEDGVLFLIASEEREWYISTRGSLRYALTDYGIQKIGEGTVSYFREGLWCSGFHYFLDSLPTYLDAMENNTPIDGYADYSSVYYHGDQEEILYYEEEFIPFFPLSLFCGIVVAAIVVFIMRLCMITKQPKRCANEYMQDNSWNLTQNRDIFLYSNVTKVRKQEPSKNTGGGSSVHRSSIGKSHGGGGGKF